MNENDQEITYLSETRCVFDLIGCTEKAGRSWGRGWQEGGAEIGGEQLTVACWRGCCHGQGHCRGSLQLPLLGCQIQLLCSSVMETTEEKGSGYEWYRVVQTIIYVFCGWRSARDQGSTIVSFKWDRNANCRLELHAHAKHTHAVVDISSNIWMGSGSFAFLLLNSLRRSAQREPLKLIFIFLLHLCPNQAERSPLFSLFNFHFSIPPSSPLWFLASRLFLPNRAQSGMIIKGGILLQRQHSETVVRILATQF